MSQDDTGALQLERFRDHGLTVDTDLPVLIDVDDIDDARRVAGSAPALGFSALLASHGLSGARSQVAAR